MLHEIFYWLFNMSIAATVTGAVVLCLRSIRRIPRRIFVFLWIVPFVRMVFPLGLSSPYSLMTLIAKFTTRTVTVYQPTEHVSFSMMNHAMQANSYFPITYKTNILEDVFHIAAVIWLVVAAAIFLALAIVYFTTLREIKDAARAQGNLYYSDKITSPAVYGIIRPRIVLPTSYQGRDIRFILLHEQTHIKYGDNLWRILGFLTAALHWFNPLAWVFLKLFLSDMELACDERVLRGLETDQVRVYAHSLLDSRQGANVFVSAFGGAAIRTRIENILSFKKMTWTSFICFVALLIAICCVLLTNAV